MAKHNCVCYPSTKNIHLVVERLLDITKYDNWYCIVTFYIGYISSFSSSFKWCIIIPIWRKLFSVNGCYCSFHISSDFNSLIFEFEVKLESLLETRPDIFNSSGVGACDGKRSIAFTLADDRSDSDKLILVYQGCRINTYFFQTLPLYKCNHI